MTILGDIGGVFAVAVAFATLSVMAALVAAAIRLIRGPSLVDRIVALDMISALLVVFLVLFKFVSGQNAYVYVAIALALVAFLATIAFANYIETRGRDGE